MLQLKHSIVSNLLPLCKEETPLNKILSGLPRYRSELTVNKIKKYRDTMIPNHAQAYQCALKVMMSQKKLDQDFSSNRNP